MVAFAHEFKSARAPSGEKPQYPGFCDKVIASDHLGSVEAVTDAQGNVLEQLSYNAWGQRRNADWTAGTPTRTTGVNRGYTDHEMLDGIGLVHMNGRVYDPVLARFLGSDPIVSDPLSAQTYNGYSYVGNNPTSATDPSGYDAESYATLVAGGDAPNYNFNFNGGNSNGFSLFGGNLNVILGGGDPFDRAWGPTLSTGSLLQARYMARFGASSVFTGLPNVANGNSYLRSANAGRGGNSTVQSLVLSPGASSGIDLRMSALAEASTVLKEVINDPLNADIAAALAQARPTFHISGGLRRTVTNLIERA